MAVYYVKHKNPRVPATDYGEKWAYDGPFYSEGECNDHISRCEYDARGVEYECVTEKELATNGNGYGHGARGLGDFLSSGDEEEE